jgi:hypothetical protein
VPFPQLFAKGKSLKSEGMGIRVYMAIYLGHVEPITVLPDIFMVDCRGDIIV